MAKKKKKTSLKTYSGIMSIILAFFTIVNIYFVLKINIFPLKYLMIFLILFFISGIIIVLNFKIKKSNTFLSALTTIFSIIFLLMFIYLNKTFGFLNNIMSKNYKIENYIVAVKKESNYEKIEDIKQISYVKTDMYNIEKGIDTLKNKIDFKEKTEKNYEEMLNNLYNGKTDAILIEESYKDLLINEASTENNNSVYETFDETTKIIYSFEIKFENENKDTSNNVEVSKEAFNIYISGIDTYGKISSVSRSDVNIIATVNPNTKQILLTTIPRDYYVELSGKKGYKDKLTHAGIYGIETSEATLENLLGIKINYNIKVNFTSLIKMVDAVGGVNVYSQYAFSGENYSFKKGYNIMNGKQALEFSRTRKTLIGGDRSRGKNQEAVIAALINKMCSKAIITNYVNILDALEDTFVTNMSQAEITELIRMQLNDMSSWDIVSISLDGTNGYEYTYSYKNQKLYVMIPLQSTITSASEKIKSVLEGEKIGSSYTESTNDADSVYTKPNTNNTNTKNPSKNKNEETNQNKNSVTNEMDTESNIEEKKESENDKKCTMVDGMCLEEYEEIVEESV